MKAAITIFLIEMALMEFFQTHVYTMPHGVALLRHTFLNLDQSLNYGIPLDRPDDHKAPLRPLPQPTLCIANDDHECYNPLLAVAVVHQLDVGPASLHSLPMAQAGRLKVDSSRGQATRWVLVFLQEQ
jgi:hypothetical protein